MTVPPRALKIGQTPTAQAVFTLCPFQNYLWWMRPPKKDENVILSNYWPRIYDHAGRSLNGKIRGDDFSHYIKTYGKGADQTTETKLLSRIVRYNYKMYLTESIMRHMKSIWITVLLILDCECPIMLPYFQLMVRPLNKWQLLL